MTLIAKVKRAALQHKQDWKAPQIKDLKLVIQENYTFIAYNKFFIAQDVPDNYF